MMRQCLSMSPAQSAKGRKINESFRDSLFSQHRSPGMGVALTLTLLVEEEDAAEDDDAITSAVTLTTNDFILLFFF